MDTEADVRSEERAAPNWWHRDHPTFTALTGFFTGLFYVLVIPAAFVGLLQVFVDDDTAEQLFPFVVVTLALPIVLLAFERTRRFGKYMLFGVLTTAVVVVGVGALTAWILISIDG